MASSSRLLYRLSYPLRRSPTQPLVTVPRILLRWPPPAWPLHCPYLKPLRERCIRCPASLNTPTAFGARLGQVYGGLHFQHRIRYANWQDGVDSGGAGLGDPQRWVGLDVTLTVLDT